MPDRSRLARALTLGAPLEQQMSQLPRVARFLNALRAIDSQLPAAAGGDIVAEVRRARTALTHLTKSATDHQPRLPATGS